MKTFVGVPVRLRRGRSFNSIRLIVLLVLIGIVSCQSSEPYCQNENCLGASLDEGIVDYRILLVGDAGANIGGKEYDRPVKIPLFTAIKHFAEMVPSRTAIVFLGDIIYNKGLPDTKRRTLESDEVCIGRTRAEKRIDAQIDILKGGAARGIFVPGNHDWDSGGKRGWKRIRNLGKYIDDSRGNKKVDVQLIPKGGCPGPITMPLSGTRSKVSLIALDTHWWLHKHEKPGKGNNPSHCKQVTENEVLRSLKKQIEEGRRKKRHILLVAHHPLMTYGKHAGFYRIKDLSNPTYFFSQLIKNFRSANRQDLNNPIYRDMRMKIQEAILESAGREGAPLIYAAGHDHSLQIIKDRIGTFHLVSGAGSPRKATRVGHKKATLFSHSNKKSGGFIAVDYLQSGKVRFAVIEPRSEGNECKHDGGKECVVFSAWAKPSPN